MGLMASYVILTQVVKTWFYRLYGEQMFFLIQHDVAQQRLPGIHIYTIPQKPDCKHAKKKIWMKMQTGF